MPAYSSRPSTYSGTVKYTQIRFASSKAAVIRNTQRSPNEAAIAPPVSGPIELPRKLADAVSPYTVPRSARDTIRPINAFAVGRMPPMNNPTPNRSTTKPQ
jgi:hypothetical protein